MYMVASSNHSSFLVPLVYLSSPQPVYTLLSASQFRTLGVSLRKDPLGRSASQRSTFGPRLLPRDWIVTPRGSGAGCMTYILASFHR